MKNNFVMLFLLFIVPNSFAATYVLNNEWSKKSYAINLAETKKIITGSVTKENQPLGFFNWAGFTTKTDKIYPIGNTAAAGQLGQLEKCDGLGNTCVVLNGYFKIYLPKDFSFEKQQRWHWGNCDYDASLKVKGQLLGVQLQQVHVMATCADDMFDLIEFDIDQTLGIVQLGVVKAEGQMNYLLSSKTGFFAKDKAGNYTF